MVIARALAAPAGPGGAAPVEAPAHPIVPIVASGGLSLKMLILHSGRGHSHRSWKTMFRGVLYRHLREARPPRRRLELRRQHRRRRFVSPPSTRKAGRHPPLMAIAVALSLAREWRARSSLHGRPRHQQRPHDDPAARGDRVSGAVPYSRRSTNLSR